MWNFMSIFCNTLINKGIIIHLYYFAIQESKICKVPDLWQIFTAMLIIYYYVHITTGSCKEPQVLVSCVTHLSWKKDGWFYDE